MTTNTLFMNATIKNYYLGLCLLFLGMPITMNAQSLVGEQARLTEVPVKILNVSMLNLGACNNQGTKTVEDDRYTGLVTITFEEIPAAGAIKISGTTDYEFDFEAENDGQNAFSFPLELPADGQKVVLSVDYIGKEKSNFLYQSFRKAEKGCTVEIIASN